MPRNIRNTRRNFARPSDSITVASTTGSIIDNNGSIGSTIVTTKNTNNIIGPSGNGNYVVTSIPSGVTGTASTTATTATVSFSIPTSASTTSYDIYVSDSNYNGAGKGVKVNTALTVGPSFNASVLVIAGGGAGGNCIASYGYSGGGGGAGGYREFNNYGLATGTNYSVTIGAGGAPSTYPDSGSDSVFSAVTAKGGGGGGMFVAGVGWYDGVTGGSGGGGASGPTGTGGPAGAGNSIAITQFSIELYTIQGRSGGTATSGWNGGGGGGGAFAVGGNQAQNNGGSGGNGRASSITGTSVTRGGGGGGGGQNNNATGGTGGGANGSSSPTSNAGTANTGGGGGGVHSTGGSGNGGNGGSGVVILRYPDTRTITIGAGLTGSTATDGSFKVTTITAGTGNVSFA